MQKRMDTFALGIALAGCGQNDPGELSLLPSREKEMCVGHGERGMSTYEIVEVFYAENEKQYRVVEKKPDGKIQDVARLTS